MGHINSIFSRNCCKVDLVQKIEKNLKGATSIGKLYALKGTPPKNSDRNFLEGGGVKFLAGGGAISGNKRGVPGVHE